MTEPKIFVGPMSKNVVDAVIALNQEFPIALIPSRRQVESDGGYVNNWTTLNFRNYVKSKNGDIQLCRDHAGPLQGQEMDDGYESLKSDCLCLDLIHLDPFKSVDTIFKAAEKTSQMLASCYKDNPSIEYEVGTEEAIFKYEPEDLDNFLSLIKQGTTPEEFAQIKYACVQSGTGLNLPDSKNTGTFDGERLKRFIEVTHKFGLLSKEHNGDFLTPNGGIKQRFVGCGLDAINIAPEFGQIETQIVMDYLMDNRPLGMSILKKICYDSKKWEKWSIGRTLNTRQLIMTAGHYVFSNKDFKTLISQFPDINIVIHNKLKERLYEIHRQTESSRV
jgi:hypothetical protein